MSAKFISRCSNQILTMKPQRQQIIDGIVMPVPGEHIRFENGEYNATEKKEIEFLRKHRLNGSAFFEDQTPQQPAAE